MIRRFSFPSTIPAHADTVGTVRPALCTQGAGTNFRGSGTSSRRESPDRNRGKCTNFLLSGQPAQTAENPCVNRNTGENTHSFFPSSFTIRHKKIMAIEEIKVPTLPTLKSLDLNAGLRGRVSVDTHAPCFLPYAPSMPQSGGFTPPHLAPQVPSRPERRLPG